jgi:hypothetical protein
MFHVCVTQRRGGRRQAFDHEAIIDRLAAPYLRRGTPIVMELVERLRVETTAHYCRAMKQSQLAYRLLDPLEQLRVYPLHLCPTPERPAAPKKAKVSASFLTITTTMFRNANV